MDNSIDLVRSHSNFASLVCKIQCFSAYSASISGSRYFLLFVNMDDLFAFNLLLADWNTRLCIVRLFHGIRHGAPWSLFMGSKRPSVWVVIYLLFFFFRFLVKELVNRPEIFKTFFVAEEGRL